MPDLNDACEYEPLRKRAAFGYEQHAKADVILGSNGKWRLCWSCAGLPEFRRYRVRKEIVRRNHERS